MTGEIEDIYQRIKTDIVTLKIRPRSKLTEETLAECFNVSRTPIRDVLKRLECDKLVDIKPKCGTSVSAINVEGIWDIMYIRAKIEQAVFAEVADIIAPRDLSQMQLMIDEQEKADLIADCGDRGRAFSRSNDVFIYFIYGLVEKEEVLRLLHHLFPAYSRFCHLMYESGQPEIERLIALHRDVVNFYEEQNRTKLIKAASDRYFGGFKWLEAIVEEHPSYFDR